MSSAFASVEEVYHRAASLTGDERVAYLNDACGSDESLRTEVEALLRHDAACSTVLDASAVAMVADAFSGDGDFGSSALAAGTIVGHYEIQRLIGRGGMGIVYLAEDLRLGRAVALKLLPEYLAPDEPSSRRLEQEARAASALNHPNICTVYDIGREGGRCYMAIEYLDGQTLAERIDAGPMAVDEMVRISVEVCDALEAAHNAGIVHLDIKPANVFLTKRGGVKVLDFGVAKRIVPGTAAVGEASRSPLASRGTESFMSPEQACGHEVDVRADIYSLGAVIHTMCTGAPPAQIRTRDAVSPQDGDDVRRAAVRHRSRRELETIVRRAMHPDRSARYATVAELRADLQALQGRREQRRRRLGYAAVTVAASAMLVLAIDVARRAPLPGDPDNPTLARRARSLAVLPLRGESGGGPGYFDAGMTEAVIAELARIAPVRVTSPRSAMLYRKTHKSMPDVARELGVDTLIDGQVTRAGDGVRVNVRQLDGSTGRILWEHAYAADIRDILALQHEVAAGISRQVSGAVSDPPDGSAVTPVRQVDPQAYEAFLKAGYFFDRQTDADFEKALRYYRESIARDPGFAPAHARLGEYYAFLAYNGQLNPEQGYGAADRELDIALKLDPRSPLAHMQRGMIDLTYRCQRVDADRELSLALRLDPSDMRILDYHSYYLLTVGRTEEAIAEKRKVLEHDPASVVTSGELGLYLLVAGRTDEAIRQLQSALELDPDDAVARSRLGWAYADSGQYGPAVEELRRAASRDRSPAILGRLGEVYARWGKTTEALAVVEQLNDMARSRYVSPLLVARIYARLGDADAAFEWVAKARPGAGPTIDDPGFASLRSDPRYVEARRRLMPDPACISL